MTYKVYITNKILLVSYKMVYLEQTKKGRLFTKNTALCKIVI